MGSPDDMKPTVVRKAGIDETILPGYMLTMVISAKKGKNKVL